MKKKEWVYRQVLHDALEQKKRRFTQLHLSKEIGISLSTVNNALKPLAKMGAVEITGRGFEVRDAEKALAYWASIRNIEKDIAYRTRVDAPVSDIEKSMPAETIYTAYSAYKFRFGEVPADYGEVYVYADADALEEIKTRFAVRKGPSNLVVLEADEMLAGVSKGGIAPLPQVYVDLWNLSEWYARDFLKALEGRFGWQ